MAPVNCHGGSELHLCFGDGWLGLFYIVTDGWEMMKRRRKYHYQVNLANKIVFRTESAILFISDSHLHFTGNKQQKAVEPVEKVMNTI